MFSFEKLKVWQEAIKLSVIIYKLTEQFPKTEIFALTDQLRRAIASVPANIAEGNSRMTGKDKAHFTNIAYSSLMEVFNHLILAKELNYIKEEEITELRVKIESIGKLLSTLRKYQLSNP